MKELPGPSFDPLREEADRLFNEGLLIFNSIGDREGMERVIDLWIRAFDLYSDLGDRKKVREVGKCLTRLYKKRFHSTYLCETDSLPVDFKIWDIFFKIGCLGFGGPMGVFALLQEELVNRRNILDTKAFLEGAVLGDILPGPVTMDIVTFTGYKLKKWKGAFYSTLLFIIPSFLIVIVLAILYEKYGNLPNLVSMFHCLGGTVCALIVSVGLSLGRREIKDYYSVGIFVCAIVSSLIFKMDIAVIVILGGLSGILLYAIPSLSPYNNSADNVSQETLRKIQGESV